MKGVITRNYYLRSMLLFIFVLNSGCTALGNLILSPHPDSLRDITDDDVSLELFQEADCKPKTKSSFVGGPIAPLLVGVGVALIKEMLSTESSKYKASYTGTASAEDFRKSNCIQLSSISSRSKRKLSIFKAPLERQATSFVLSDATLTVHGFKSKVAAWPIVTLLHGRNPFDGDTLSSIVGNALGLINPFMMVHALYGLFDDDVYRVDIKVKAKIDVILSKGGGDNVHMSLGKIELPIGKASIFELENGKIFTNLKTGYLPRPSEASALPTNAVVTVVEANDFGDVVGKAAGIVGDEKGGFTDWLTGSKK
jgi:hypothetical protein